VFRNAAGKEPSYNIGMTETTITELDGLYREAVAMSDWSAADHYDRQISLRMNNMWKSGELDYYDDDDSY